MTDDGTAAVTLLTARLRLRPYRTADLAARAALGAMPAVYRFTGGVPATAEESWHRLLRYIGHWSAFGYGFFAVEARATGRFVGEAGAMDFRRGIGGGYGDVPEAGWMFVPEVHGTGIAGEAMRAVLDWLDPRQGRDGTVCMIDPDNVASQRLAARIGYVAHGVATYHGRPLTTYVRPAGATFATAPG
ncbi:GNAT family N-acetyltransferase [Sphingomonas montana]|uniref:GNAT family N-acetyltransferase n=1 Tax=Sphingomonas montana TaxID=1843236 RepID=UPI00096FBE0B|nr:GNAT family N-acetyltransferase [Sphingomonas montana]